MIKNFLLYTLLYILPLIFFTDLTRNPYYFQIAFFIIIVCILWILTLSNWIIKKQIDIKVGYCDPPLLLFFVVAFLSIIVTYFSDHNYHVPQIIKTGKDIINTDYLRSSIYSESLKKIIFTVVNMLLIYYLALNLRNNQIHKTYHLIFAAGFVASIYGILQYFGMELIWRQEINPYGIKRCISTFGNPNFLSSYLGMLFPIIFSYMISETKNKWKEVTWILIALSGVMFLTMYMIGERSPNLFPCFLGLGIIWLVFNSIAHYKPSIIYLALIMVFYIALLATLTRSTWFGLFIGMLFYLILLAKFSKDVFKKFKWKFATLIAIALMLFIHFPRDFQRFGEKAALQRIINEFREHIGKPYHPLHQRFLIWLCANDMIKEKPLLGKGWGCFELFYPFYQGKYLFHEWLRFRTHANNSHNEILEIWSQTGFLGFGLYILFFVTLFVFAFKTLKQLTEDKKILYIGVFSSIPVMLTDNLLNVSLHFCIPAGLFWWNIGILMNLSLHKNYNLEIKSKLVNPLLYCLIFILILISIQYWNRFLGEVNYFEGFKHSKRNMLNEAQKPLEKAERLHLEVNNNYELGNVYARRGLLDKAIWAYYRALAANCGYDEIHFNLASIFAQKGDIENAYHNYTQALFINPLSKEAYFALGSLFLQRLDKYREHSIKLFEQAVKIFPKEPHFWNNLGYIYMLNNEPEKAIQAYETALKIDPNFQPARLNLINLLNQLRKTNLKIPKIKSHG